MPNYRPCSSLGFISKNKKKTNISLDNLSIGKTNSFAHITSWTHKFKQETNFAKKYSDTLNKLNQGITDNTYNTKYQPDYIQIVDSLKQKNKLLQNQHSDLKKKISILEQKLSDTNLCEICFEKKKNILCVPCNHISICESCSPHINSKCPICRTPVTQIKKVFI